MTDITDILLVVSIVWPIAIFSVYYMRYKEEYPGVSDKLYELQKDIDRLSEELHKTEIKSVQLMDKVKSRTIINVNNPLSTVVD